MRDVRKVGGESSSTVTLAVGEFHRIRPSRNRLRLLVWNTSLNTVRWRAGNDPTGTTGAPIYARGSEELWSNDVELVFTPDSTTGTVTLEVYEERVEG